MTQPILKIQNLTVQLGARCPVEGVSLTVNAGETHALVGESGSGKTLTALSVPQLLPRPLASIPSGKILFEGQDLLELPAQSLQDYRGKQIGMVFQEPLSCLNPVQTIGRQLGEALRVHGVGVAEVRQRVPALLERVGLAPQVAHQFPHELSGGMRQRVLIAQAVAHRPRLLIADEPTSALDFDHQNQILSLLRELQAELGMGILLITHDFRVVARAADRVSVVYAGQVVESGAVAVVLKKPEHPYTQALQQCLPRRERRGQPLPTLPGVYTAPSLSKPQCRFAPRCGQAVDICHHAAPELVARWEERVVRCWLLPEEKQP